MKTATIFLLLGAALALTALISLGLGAVYISPADALAALRGAPRQDFQAVIVRDFRLARILLVMVSGASLSAAGAAFQGLFRNPLADPYIVGASSGAALGAALSVIFGAASLSVSAFVGALAAVLLVYALAENSGYDSVAALLLAGAALSAVLSAGVSLLMLLHQEAMSEIFAWLMGGFSGRSWSHLQRAAWGAFFGSGLVWLMARPLDALAAGEGSAESLGLNVRRARFILVAGASLATAAAVSAGGVIAFVGLIAPHMARRLTGYGHARSIPAAMLLGALLLLLADDLARTLLAPIELPVGIFTAFLGGPFFLFLLKKRRAA